MKQVIIEKLFNGEELESNEILEITKSLKDDNVEEIKPYNHSETTLFEACSLSENDADEFNNKVSTVLKESKSLSEIVEYCERLIETNSNYKRLVVIQAVKFAKVSNDPFMRLFLGM